MRPCPWPPESSSVGHSADTGFMSADLASVGRVAGWLLVAGLTIAATAAVVVLVQGDFDETEARVIYTSLGFALASATGSAGARAITRASAGLHALGVATVACSVVAFGLFALAIWGRDLYEGTNDLWRVIGCVAVAGVAGAHACLGRRGLPRRVRRPGRDPAAQRPGGRCRRDLGPRFRRCARRSDACVRAPTAAPEARANGRKSGSEHRILSQIRHRGRIDGCYTARLPPEQIRAFPWHERQSSHLKALKS
jgi:hypothetical protein